MYKYKYPLQNICLQPSYLETEINYVYTCELINISTLFQVEN